VLHWTYQPEGLKMKGNKMNIDTQRIAQLLNISLENALKIQDHIDNNWLLDWSECSERKFRSVVKSVATEVLA
jgi:hypothetical protein